MTKAAQYVGSITSIDWDQCVEKLATLKGIDVTTDPTRWNLDNAGYTEIYNNWKEANFNHNAIKWTNYYPDQHFSNSIIDQIATYLDIKVHRAWISKIDPGYFAPWHWDVDDNESEYLKKGSIKRYSCFIKEPAHGHIFVVGDQYLFNEPKGGIYKWRNYKEWHSGINAGMSPKYMLHILGY